MSDSSPEEILVLIETDADGQPLASSLAAVTFARRLCQIKPSGIALCLLHGSADINASGILRLGATNVFRFPCFTQTPPFSEEAAPVLVHLVTERNIVCVIAAATSTGKDLLPRIAALLDCAYVADCCELSTHESAVAFVRPVYAGNAVAICVARSKIVVLSVRYSEFPPAQTDSSTLSPVVPVTLRPPTHAVTRMRRLGFDAVQSSRPRLTEARVIVSGGRALSARFSDVLGPLADCLGAAIGATRAACDAGYAPSDFQVGQTGKIVAPDLYFAIGISGAVQHLAGIRSARVVVAINADPEAPIFSVADYGLVGDLFELVPQLVSAIQQRKRSLNN